MDQDKSEHEKRIEAELQWCFTFDPERREMCAGASGRKLRQICVWCPNYRKGAENNEKDN